jgi:uncharacterized protein YqhQ
MMCGEARRRPNVGGQAVIEGVMMRSPTRIATAVRNPHKEIVVKAEDYTSLAKRHRLFDIPVIRGALALVETLVIAVRALSFSADQAALDDESGKGMGVFQTSVTILLALVLGIAIFFYVPLLLTEWIGFESGFFFNLVDGLFRLVFMILYIVLITRWKEMRRIFEYHGAEHKTIFAFEKEGEISINAASKYSTVHPRCSTSFLLLVVIVSVLIFILLGKPDSIGDRLLRFAFIPVIGGISYELLRLSSKPRFSRIMQFIVWPGLFMQRYTTREPDADQLEVAVAALKACIGDKVLES